MPKQYLLLVMDEPETPFDAENPPNLMEAHAYVRHFDADPDPARAQVEAAAFAAEYATRHSLTGVVGYAWTESE